MRILNFDQNWNNKLFCNCFTSIRIHDPIKFQAGELYSITLERKPFRVARLLEIRCFLLKDMSEAMARIDTGKEKKEAIKILKSSFTNPNIIFENKIFAFLLFEIVDKNLNPGSAESALN